MTDLQDYNSDPLGDLQDWAGETDDSFNAFSPTGVENDISPVDIAAMDVIGFHAVSTHIVSRAASGNWSAAGSWNPGSVPGAGDAVYLAFGDGVNRNISYDYTGAAVTLYSLTVDLTHCDRRRDDHVFHVGEQSDGQRLRGSGQRGCRNVQPKRRHNNIRRKGSG